MRSKTAHKGLRTWIEVDRKAVKHNFNVFEKLIAKRTKLMAVVKSNGYGHGLIDFSREMEKLGADFLGVDSVTEGLALRREGIKLPILILGYTLPEMVAAASANDISITVSSFEIIRYIAANSKNFSKPLRVHIKVDTGMHRQGFLLRQQKTLISKIKTQNAKIVVEGLYTHFASAKNPAFPKDTLAQLAEFKKWIAAFQKEGMRPMAHAAATAGCMLLPESHFDMVRIGIGLYGLWPAAEVKEFLKKKISLEPALVWKSIITEIKKLPKGSRIGYDLAETLDKESKVAIVPVGYWHGYPRALSSIGRVIVQGQMSRLRRNGSRLRSANGQVGGQAKVIGRVSMDMITIDVTDIKGVSLHDEVTIMGKKITAEELGALTDSSCYEIVTRINPLIKRIFT
ncbi:MAG: alanine racemase [Candidatus Taylorbacteria bacterium]|nr:alanine racemase [Candidatus Taylorbacteria bacterium]